MGQVRLKLTYRERTFRRTVESRAFTWAAFLQWCVFALSLTHTRIVMIGKRGKGGEGENRWAVMLCCVVHVWVLVLRCSGP